MLARYHGLSYIYVAAMVPTPRFRSVGVSFSLWVRMFAFWSHQQQAALHQPFWYLVFGWCEHVKAVVGLLNSCDGIVARLLWRRPVLPSLIFSYRSCLLLNADGRPLVQPIDDRGDGGQCDVSSFSYWHVLGVRQGCSSSELQNRRARKYRPWALLRSKDCIGQWIDYAKEHNSEAFELENCDAAVAKELSNIRN